MNRHHGNHDLAAIAASVWQQCRDDNFAGHDPYDGLKSGVLAPILPWSRLLRIAVIQGVKRCPLNLRPLLAVPKGHNPKALALLMQAVAQKPELAGATDRQRLGELCLALASRPDGSAWIPGRLPGVGLPTDAVSGLGWGYDFPWQSKAFLQPAFYPTVVCTSFVIDGLADLKHADLPLVLQGAARFVRHELHRHEEGGGVCYSYSPRDHTRVYNASLFAGKILAHATARGVISDVDHNHDEVRRIVDYVVSRQRADGAWIYGEADHWQWIDNLHTGFVLETLADISELMGTKDQVANAIEKGLAYYRQHLFDANLVPRYFADQEGVVDSHTVAQAAITLARFASEDAGLLADARTVLEHGIERLWMPKRNGFAFQQGRITSRTVFLRWSQAWMLRAICTVLAQEETTT